MSRAINRAVRQTAWPRPQLRVVAGRSAQVDAEGEAGAEVLGGPGVTGERYRGRLAERLAAGVVRDGAGESPTELNQFFLWHRSALDAPEVPWEACGGGSARAVEPRGAGAAVATELPKPLVVVRFDRRTEPAGTVAIE
ncbi:hypothetical protein ACWIGI_06285 [Nocardia sp. NPDC055321]